MQLSDFFGQFHSLFCNHSSLIQLRVYHWVKNNSKKRPLKELIFCCKPFIPFVFKLGNLVKKGFGLASHFAV